MGYFLNPQRYDFSGNVLGLGVGANYCYKKAAFFSGELAGATAKRGRTGRYGENANGGYREQDFKWISLAALHHHAVGRLDFGYGLSGAWQYCRESEVYDYNNRDDERLVLREANQLTIGLATSVNFRLTNDFCVGFNYQPQFLSLAGNGAVIAYSHLASTGFFWRLPIRNTIRG